MEEKKSKITLRKVDGDWILTVPWSHIGTREYNFGSGSGSFTEARRTALSIKRSELA